MKSIINLQDPDSYVTCKVCNQKFSRMTKTHLKKHDLTPEEYKNKYNVTKNEYVCKKVCRLQAITKESMIDRYGEEIGLKKWQSYCDKQAYTNTYDYKKEKYGWNKEQFDQYNKSRAVTRDNLIKRHGEEIGLKKWKSYCDRQTYAGSSLEYFINKHGLIEGQKVWDQICKAKATTLANYKLRHGEEIGLLKFNEFLNKRALTREHHYSIISQELFNEITKNLKDKQHIYYQAYTKKEYGCWLTSINKYTFLDFYDLSKNKGIEFYGNYWHCNPKFYTDDYIHPHLKITAKELHETDLKRIETLKKEFNIDILIVWEDNYIKDKIKVLQECKEFMGYEL